MTRSTLLGTSLAPPIRVLGLPAMTAPAIEQGSARYAMRRVQRLPGMREPVPSMNSTVNVQSEG